ncbi:GGDEF domain-containing protein (plasmid) [Rhizobium sp. TRM96647]|uniref:GGDEF domain-containing protein n=1 Tax=unclassified Rhizobium TaxID=2613769 RepID=UPI0021E8BE36|nr:MULTISPECIES: GGDEF domain-containing protein [unclassified Rhizobium]MCV3735458.1 GGDEF domain-containing protein [Rhizobium sp. TRM96647]MCV3757779.1 GGDEF domain-containing protein [Rhizobium sp. TRM96650]
MNQRKSSTNDVALRVATAMQQMGIDGLPRNYELVYEAYAGVNPELVRDFIALGKFKTQAALDELGRKYLPHHHEESVLQRSAGAVRDEMTNFMALLQEEKTSLSDYGRLIGEASQAIFSGDQGSAQALGNSIERLRQATERQATRNAAMEARVANQSETMDTIQRDLAAFEATKFTDAATGLGNRRAFNKAVAKVYANPELPLPCALAVVEVDVGKRFSPIQVDALNDYLVRHYGSLIKRTTPSNDVVCRFDGFRFGFLFYTTDETEVGRLMTLLRTAFAAATLKHPETMRSLGSLTFSAGICMVGSAGNAFDFVNLAEKSLQQALAAGGNRIVLHRDSEAGGEGKDWMLYRAG